MRVRRFIRPFVYGGRVTIGANVRVNLMRHPGNEAGRIVFDGLYWVRGTTSQPGTRLITDCEAMLDLATDWGQSEGGLWVPICGDADVARPFFLDAEDIAAFSGTLVWHLLGYVGGELEDDDGFFEPPRNAAHFVESSVRGGVACPNGIITDVLTFQTPAAEHGIRATRLDIFSTAPATVHTVFMNGPGLEAYKSLPVPELAGFASPAFIPMIARLEPLRTYTIQILRSQIGTSTHGVSLHGWSW